MSTFFRNRLPGLQRLWGFHERRVGRGRSWSSTLGPHRAAAACEVEEPMGSDDRCCADAKKPKKNLWSAEIFADVGWFSDDLSLFICFFWFFNNSMFFFFGLEVSKYILKPLDCQMFFQKLFPPNHEVLRSKDISTAWSSPHRAWLPCRVVPKLWNPWRCHTLRPCRMRKKGQIQCLVDDVYFFHVCWRWTCKFVVVKDEHRTIFFVKHMWHVRRLWFTQC